MNNLGPIAVAVTVPDMNGHYQDCVRKFLKTVVVFDDQAYAGSQKSSNANMGDMQLQAPASVDSAFATNSADQISNPQVAAAQAKDSNSVSSSAAETSAHDLDGKMLVRNFAQVGIACSVIEPDEAGGEAELINQITRMSLRADVLILDWSLKKGFPELTSSAIKEIFECDDKAGERLRLIVIYTAENTATVSERLVEKITDLEIEENLPATLRRKHAMIVILNKTTPTNAGIDTDALPEAIVKAHARLTAGLLPSAALNAIAAIRDNTHHLLGQFPNTLDAAYITHRCLIPHPEDAEKYFIELFTDALKNIIMHENARETISIAKCENWVKAHNASLQNKDESKLNDILGALKNPSNDKPAMFKGWAKPATLDIPEQLDTQIKDWAVREERLSEQLVEVIGSFAKTNNRFQEALMGKLDISPEKVSELLAEYLYPDIAQRTALDEMTVLSDFSRTPKDPSVATSSPRLHLGTVVALGPVEAPEFLMCIQPHCDSVRFTDPIGFPFLKLKSAKNDTYDLCLPWNKDYKRVILEKLPKHLQIIEFKPTNKAKKRFVEAKIKIEGGQKQFYFQAANDQSMIWVGEIRLGKAQRLSSTLAARLHTLGIDEFEYSRIRGIK